MKTLHAKTGSKLLFKILLVLSMFILIPQNSNAQILKKLKKKTEKKIEREAEKRIEKRIDKKIDEGFDEVEGEIDGEDKNDKGIPDKKDKTNNPNKEEKSLSTNKPKVVWSKFDFVPGDTVIFEDGPSVDEENGEFPNRWDLIKGQVEIASFEEENVMMFIDGNPKIVPYLKNSKEDYLPDTFTIEFDLHRPVNGNRVSVYLYDYKNQKNTRNMYMDISYNSISEKHSNIKGEHPGIDYKWNSRARWMHISIAYTKGKLKVYMDDTRIINIPHYEGNPSGLTLEAYWADLGEDKAFYFKNVRIAKGGVKYYDRVLSEGKIIINGIKFDTNKATLKDESMGPINKIFKLMQKQPELSFSIEGHTDSDGGDDANMELSKARGKTVMKKLIDMGIQESRLKSNGFGESKPIDDNGTPEGKANNRRVEFVKF